MPPGRERGCCVGGGPGRIRRAAPRDAVGPGRCLCPRMQASLCGTPAPVRPPASVQQAPALVRTSATAPVRRMHLPRYGGKRTALVRQGRHRPCGMAFPPPRQAPLPPYGRRALLRTAGGPNPVRQALRSVRQGAAGVPALVGRRGAAPLAGPAPPSSPFGRLLSSGRLPVRQALPPPRGTADPRPVRQGAAPAPVRQGGPPAR
jgi:hypothetical protein